METNMPLIEVHVIENVFNAEQKRQTDGDPKDGLGNVRCRGWTADLVTHDPHLALRFTQPKHRPYEVCSERAEDPGGP